MRAWFLQGEPGSESDAFECLVRQWASRPENDRWSVDWLRGTPDMATLLPERQPDVLLLAESSCPIGLGWTDALPPTVGLVVATSLQRDERFRQLAEHCVLHLTPLPSSVEAIGLAIFNVLAELRRQHAGQTRIDQLQQRLRDRILIERAKGILVEHLKISEKEAYDRLRLQSRRQRRPIRDIAQCLLDAQSLFAPEMKELVEPLPRNGQVAAPRPSLES
jgi:hypothetical protein